MIGKDKGISSGIVILIMIVVGAIGAVAFVTMSGEEKAPAKFEVSNLNISPSDVGLNDPVKISADVSNMGGKSGEYTVELEVDGTVEDTQMVSLNSGENTVVTFTVQKTTSRKYSVEIGGLSQSFEVFARNAEIVESFDFTQETDVGLGGLAWDGQYLWCTVSEESEESGYPDTDTYKIDPSDGSVIKSMDQPGYWSQGLAWDGQYLWYDKACRIYKINVWNGSVIKSLRKPTDSVSKGLAWDGQCLWSVGSEQIYRIDPSNGVAIKSIDAPGLWSIGLAWDGQYLWNVRDTNSPGQAAKIYKIDPSDGSVIGSSYLQEIRHPTGLAWDGQYLWCAERATDSGEKPKIYKIDTHIVD